MDVVGILETLPPEIRAKDQSGDIVKRWKADRMTERKKGNLTVCEEP